ncbi:DNA-binding transcriptional LysR family regulator [Rhizobium sullae]|uniref:DNA-binding transcriptional LysR family regulator n=1 Tax=Rhizobium sullae TaxID=50338 RepID=A0A4R3Q6E2_RHISU|nr:DNA-binding transcriptional LysR family regulator [Rhizobium sullae]
MRLFDRTTRKVSLTDAGLLYLDHARRIVEQLNEADQVVSSLDGAMSGRLAIGAPVGFGTTVLADYLIDFKRTHPGLLLDVSLTDSFVDVVAERLDVAIRMSGVVDDRLIARRLGVIERCLAATPAYLERQGRPQHPCELSGHDYILHSNVVGGERFRLMNSQGETCEIRMEPVFCSDNSALTGQAISAGLGIGLIHKVLLDPLVADGTLEHVLPDWRYEPQFVHAVYPSNRYVPIKVRAFVEGLSRHLQSLKIFSHEHK